MAILPIRILGDPVLHTSTTPVPIGPDRSLPSQLSTLISDMFDTLAAAGGVALSANQVGFDLRLFVYDCPLIRGEPARRRGVMVNPTLQIANIPTDPPHPVDDLEGCLSVPGEMF